MTDFIRIAAAAPRRVSDRPYAASAPRVTRAPLACVWTADPETGRLASRWISADIDQSQDDQPRMRRDVGQPPNIPLAA